MYQYSNSLIRQFQSSVTGNAAVGVQATVYVGETGAKASLFEVNGSPKSNPVTTDDKGFYSFSLADGDYRIVFSSSQFATLRISVLDGAQIREDFEDLVASNTEFRNQQQAAYDAFVLSQGWDQVGTFAAGFTFTSPNQVGQDVDGNWWRWNGSLPKTVTAGTLPSSDANYKLVGDGVLRNDLAATNSTVLVGGVEAEKLASRYNDYLVISADKTAASSAVPAINAAIAIAVAKGGSDRANIVGTTIKVPDGRYLLDAPLSALSVSGITLEGSSETACTLVVTHNGAMATIGDPSLTRSPVGITFKNFRIEYQSAPTISARVFEIGNAFSVKIENLVLENVPTLVSAGQASNRIAGGVVVSNVYGSIANAGMAMFDLRYGAGLFISKVGVFVRGVLPPTHPESMTTVLNTGVFRCATGFWDTIQCTNAIFERFDYGLSCISSSGMVYQNFYFSNTIMDYFKRHCIYAETNGGVVAGICFDDTCWFVSWESDAISIINVSGYNDAHKIKGNVIIAGSRGVYYQNQSGKMNDFSGMHVSAVNRLGTAQGAMVFAAGSTGFVVNGASGNIDTSSVGLPWRADYGMVVSADCDDYQVSNNKFDGAIGGYSFAPNSTGSPSRRAANNSNANYAGKKTQTIPASSTPYVNTSPHVEEWSFFGGTITGGYSKNGFGLPGALPYVTFRLQPGDSFSVGYSVAPTIQVFVEP